MSVPYTERLLDHFRHPRNRGRLDAPDLAAEEYNALCGDRVTVEARVQEGRVVELRFEGRGCALCLAAASILTEALAGRVIDDLAAMSDGDLLAELRSPVRPSRLSCALLPWRAFRRAAFGEEAS